MSELHAHRRSRTNPAFWRVYMGCWGLLAAGALAYLSVVALHPEHQRRLALKPAATQNPAVVDADHHRLTAQVRDLNATVSSLRSDLKRLRTTGPASTTASNDAPAANDTAAPNFAPRNFARPIESQSAPEAINETRITTPVPPDALPTAPSNRVTTSALPEPATVQNTPRDAQTRPAILPDSPSQAEDVANQPGTNVAQQQLPLVVPARNGPNLATKPLRPGALPPLPPRRLGQRQASAARNPNTPGPYQPTLINADAGQTSSAPINRIQTGSITPPRRPAPAANQPSPFGNPVITPQPTASGAAVTLSTAGSVTGLRASWLLLTTRHAGPLAGLEPRYIENSNDGTFRLVAGPLANRGEADRVCNGLRAEGVTCGVSDFMGTPF